MMDVLTKAREASGLSGRMVSEKLRRSHNFASLVESGERTLSVCEFIEFARVCEADPVALFKDIASQ